MFNIGIITFKETASGIASFFSIPKVEECFAVKLGNESFTFNIITCLYNAKTRIDQRKMRQISKLCRENGINLLVSAGKPDRVRLHSAELSDTAGEVREIKAIKLLGALIRISQIKGEDLLGKSIGFTTANADFEAVNLLSEEAANIMVFEGARMDEASREALYLQVMQSRGVSVIFTKDLLKVIRNSDVLVVDESIDFSQYASHIRNKVLLGANNNLKESIAVSKVLLWPEPVGTSLSNLVKEKNDELLAILRYCTKEMDYMEFLSLLPYIYIFDGNGKPYAMP